MDGTKMYIEKSLKKFGTTVEVKNDTIIKTKAFINPLKRRHALYTSNIEKRLFENEEARKLKLYIGNANVPVTTQSIITYDDKRYSVVSTETQTIRTDDAYTWAILQPIED